MTNLALNLTLKINFTIAAQKTSSQKKSLYLQCMAVSSPLKMATSFTQHSVVWQEKEVGHHESNGQGRHAAYAHVGMLVT